MSRNDTSGIAPLVSVVTTDFGAITRGRAVAAARFDKIAAGGVGWLPVNFSITPFNGIATPNPWGSRGDLRLVPDPNARYRTGLTGAATAFDLAMGDLFELDGTPWRACPRTLLRQALVELRELTGLELIAAFEQEFVLDGLASGHCHALSNAALRGVDPFAPQLMAALDEAGIEPEVFVAEFGTDQFEVTCGPADGVRAADRAVAIREIVREIARHQGLRASFTPKIRPDGVGSGVHVHFSFTDAAGRPATAGDGGPGGLGTQAAAFCAGVLAHLPSILIFTAPSPVSYLRLRPHSWSASWTSLAELDREAALRICPTTVLNGDRARQFNVEFRAADATGNPYLVLAAIVRAGLEGLRRKLPAPSLTEGDPEAMDDAQRRALGLRRLPDSLESAIIAFEGDTVASSWFAPEFNDTYLGVRRAELARAEGLGPAELCELYKALY